MTPEFYAVIGTAIVLGGLILNGQRAVGERLTRIEGGIGNLRERVSRLEEGMLRLEGRVSGLEERISRLGERMNTLEGHLNAMDGRLSTLESVIVQVFGGKSAPR